MSGQLVVVKVVVVSVLVVVVNVVLVSVHWEWDVKGASVKVDVVEIIPEIIDWNKIWQERKKLLKNGKKVIKSRKDK